MRTRATIEEFKRELTEWPDAETDDMVMGHWFLHFNRYKLPTGLRVSQARNGIQHPYGRDMPDRVKDEAAARYNQTNIRPRTDGAMGHRARRHSA